MSKSMKSWRDSFPVHPAAELFPQMTTAELRQLGDDIKASGMRVPITVLHTKTASSHSLMAAIG
jgi:hypothetical protein